jgi:hypothetical protein
VIMRSLPSRNSNETPSLPRFVGIVGGIEKSVSRSGSSVLIDRNRNYILFPLTVGSVGIRRWDFSGMVTK